MGFVDVGDICADDAEDDGSRGQLEETEDEGEEAGENHCGRGWM